MRTLLKLSFSFFIITHVILCHNEKGLVERRKKVLKQPRHSKSSPVKPSGGKKRVFSVLLKMQFVLTGF